MPLLCDDEGLERIAGLENGIPARPENFGAELPHSLLVLDQQHRLRPARELLRPGRSVRRGDRLRDPRQVDREGRPTLDGRYAEDQGARGEVRGMSRCQVDGEEPG